MRKPDHPPWPDDGEDRAARSGGIDMERALVQYLKEKNAMMAGRKVDLLVGDSGGVPAQSRTKRRSWSSATHIHVMIGPLDHASALATDDTPAGAAPDAVGGRGRGHDAEEAQSWLRAHLDLVAMRDAARRLLLQDAEDAPHGA